ncbi:uncharacterized protein BCR38DRAFT_487090 [Pseudomassariella vexata]|uniref:Uncharacterized protein n=1 Tax=Pseudomassariella vexata TaxID=1141098 RepID=A0A1Y2DQF0_9PEZI|nr:uncharacterized protein BCR38DRAFT_487090 [Pseudomassariella vexata]ORY61336.1 hypothetical protein BCR38DRAFT_487090 [Pseudomassariella vexata]
MPFEVRFCWGSRMGTTLWTRWPVPHLAHGSLIATWILLLWKLSVRTGRSYDRLYGCSRSALSLSPAAQLALQLRPGESTFCLPPLSNGHCIVPCGFGKIPKLGQSNNMDHGMAWDVDGRRSGSSAGRKPPIVLAIPPIYVSI